MSPILGILASSSYTPATSFDSIATLTSNATIFTFSSIPSTYSHLQLRMFIPVSSGTNWYLRFNGVSSSQYWYGNFETNGTSNAAPASTAATNLYINGGNYYLGWTEGAAAVVDIYNYTTSGPKNVFATYGYYGDATYRSAAFSIGGWNNTSAIDEIRIVSSNTTLSGTSIALYGIQ